MKHSETELDYKPVSTKETIMLFIVPAIVFFIIVGIVVYYMYFKDPYPFPDHSRLLDLKK